MYSNSGDDHHIRLFIYLFTLPHRRVTFGSSKQPMADRNAAHGRTVEADRLMVQITLVRVPL